jgi:caffeoyl-CoA O-methyltransferase
MKYVTLDDSLYQYICEHQFDAGDTVLKELRARTLSLGDASRMQISGEQGAFFSVLVSSVGARSAIEVGTFTGYSSICIARALPEDGRLICVDSNREWTNIAREFWAKAKVEGKIDLRLGDAVSKLRELEPNAVFDFAFVDADKREYDAYYELLLPRIRPNGLIVFDNMLWGAQTSPDPEERAKYEAVDRMNRKLSQDSRIQAVLLPIAQGIQICRKR